ncbi:hypothetical protein [Massilia sp. WF1]|uniref:hypothetical protein n=1 Tax=Massilia sp. WF1 TaxID=1406431 RepID=UPI0012E21CD5|nr:hypothetical protein [Massilia sp. WF1]
MHFFSLILQRIQQQNAPEPLAFEAKILYENKVERKITCWQAFQHFTETQNIVSVAVQFNLALLIHFPSKETPERQEIIIGFDANNRRKALGVFDSILGISGASGIIGVEIRHTERTWADDILRLIETEISNIQVPEAKLRIYLRKAFGPLSAFSFPIMLVGSLAYTQWTERNDGISDKAAKLIKVGDTSLQVLHDKINILILEAERNSTGRVGNLKVVIYSLLVAVLIYIVGIFLAQPNPSFVFYLMPQKEIEPKFLND